MESSSNHGGSPFDRLRVSEPATISPPADLCNRVPVRPESGTTTLPAGAGVRRGWDVQATLPAAGESIWPFVSRAADHAVEDARIEGPYALCYPTVGRGVAQLGSAPAWGAGGRWFESSLPDQSPSTLRGVVSVTGGSLCLDC